LKRGFKSNFRGIFAPRESQAANVFPLPSETPEKKHLPGDFRAKIKHQRPSPPRRPAQPSRRKDLFISKEGFTFAHL
jgi:hypothetical protein